MTLIAFATYGDHAEFITDSTSYTQTVSMGRCTKSITLPHMDAAVLSQGSSMFGDYAKSVALQVSAQVATFDDLVETAPAMLADMWQRVNESTSPAESVAFLIGWSIAAQEFVAYAFASEQGFKPVQIKSTWVMPCPWDNRPSGIELRRMKVWMHDHPDRDEAARLWALKKPRPRPASVEDWVQVAKDAREQRSLSGSFAHVIVAGDVFHTRLGRGEVATRRVHRFDDSGEEFQTMISGTQHPQAQMDTCWCDSGQTYRDCHLADYYADGHTCDCGSGQAFQGCCRVNDAQPVLTRGGVV